MKFRYKIKNHIFNDKYDVKIQVFNSKTNKWNKFTEVPLWEICEMSHSHIENKCSVEEGCKIHNALVHGWDLEAIVLVIQKFGVVNDFMIFYIKEILRKRDKENLKNIHYNDAVAYLDSISDKRWTEISV